MRFATRASSARRHGRGPVYAIRLSGIIIGHSALERIDASNRAATGRLEPTGAFEQWQRPSEELRAAERAADQAAGSLEERRRNRELVAETLGWRVLDATSRVVGRVASLSDVEPEAVGIEVRFDEPGREQLRFGQAEA
jgi:hypothetical protein